MDPHSVCRQCDLVAPARAACSQLSLLAVRCSVGAELTPVLRTPQQCCPRNALEQLSALPRRSRRNNELLAGILVGTEMSRSAVLVILEESAAKFLTPRVPRFWRLILCQQLVGSSVRSLEGMLALQESLRRA